MVTQKKTRQKSLPRKKKTPLPTTKPTSRGYSLLLAILAALILAANYELFIEMYNNTDDKATQKKSKYKPRPLPLAPGKKRAKGGPIPDNENPETRRKRQRKGSDERTAPTPLPWIRDWGDVYDWKDCSVGRKKLALQSISANLPIMWILHWTAPEGCYACHSLQVRVLCVVFLHI